MKNVYIYIYILFQYIYIYSIHNIIIFTTLRTPTQNIILWEWLSSIFSTAKGCRFYPHHLPIVDCHLVVSIVIGLPKNPF